MKEQGDFDRQKRLPLLPALVPRRHHRSGSITTTATAQSAKSTKSSPWKMPRLRKSSTMSKTSNVERERGDSDVPDVPPLPSQEQLPVTPRRSTSESGQISSCSPYNAHGISGRSPTPSTPKTYDNRKIQQYDVIEADELDILQPPAPAFLRGIRQPHASSSVSSLDLCSDAGEHSSAGSSKRASSTFSPSSPNVSQLRLALAQQAREKDLPQTPPTSASTAGEPQLRKQSSNLSLRMAIKNIGRRLFNKAEEANVASTATEAAPPSSFKILSKPFVLNNVPMRSNTPSQDLQPPELSLLGSIRDESADSPSSFYKADSVTEEEAQRQTPIYQSNQVTSGMHDDTESIASEDDYGADASSPEKDTRSIRSSVYSAFLPEETQLSFAVTSPPFVATRAATGLRTAGGKALYACTINKLHPHLSTENIGELGSPRSMHRTSDLRDHHSTSSVVRDMRILIARTLIIRRIKYTSLQAQEERELESLVKKYLPLYIPPQEVTARLNQRAPMTIEEFTRPPLQGVSTATSSDGMKKWLARLPFVERMQCVKAIPTSHLVLQSPIVHQTMSGKGRLLRQPLQFSERCKALAAQSPTNNVREAHAEHDRSGRVDRSDPGEDVFRELQEQVHRSRDAQKSTSQDLRVQHQTTPNPKSDPKETITALPNEGANKVSAITSRSHRDSKAPSVIPMGHKKNSQSDVSNRGLGSIESVAQKAPEGHKSARLAENDEDDVPLALLPSLRARKSSNTLESSSTVKDDQLTVRPRSQTQQDMLKRQIQRQRQARLQEMEMNRKILADARARRNRTEHPEVLKSQTYGAGDASLMISSKKTMSRRSLPLSSSPTTPTPLRQRLSKAESHQLEGVHDKSAFAGDRPPRWSGISASHSSPTTVSSTAAQRHTVFLTPRDRLFSEGSRSFADRAHIPFVPGAMEERYKSQQLQQQPQPSHGFQPAPFASMPMMFQQDSMPGFGWMPVPAMAVQTPYWPMPPPTAQQQWMYGVTQAQSFGYPTMANGGAYLNVPLPAPAYISRPMKSSLSAIELSSNTSTPASSCPSSYSFQSNDAHTLSQRRSGNLAAQRTGSVPPLSTTTPAFVHSTSQPNVRSPLANHMRAA